MNDNNEPKPVSSFGKKYIHIFHITLDYPN